MKKFIKRLIVLIIIICLLFGGYFVFKKYDLKAGLEALRSKGFLITDYSNLKGSKLTGDNYNFNSTYNPYYGMLSSNGKKLYKQTYANMVNRKKYFIPRVKMNYKDVNNVIEAVMNDNPELFWVDNTYSYKYTSDKVCRQVILSYNGLSKNYKHNKNVFDSRVNSIVYNANKLSSNYEKELYVHDYLRRNIVYNKASSYNQTAYSAIVSGRTVCAGYAKAFQYIMSRLGIPTYYVTGRSQGEDHAWNIIRLDGYYNVDVTWDDTSSSSYAYFNKTDREFNSSHTRNSLSRYLPSCNATTYSYSNMNKTKKKSTPSPSPKPTPTVKPTPTPSSEPDIEEETDTSESEDE
ncbi:MAG: hypothetical protein IKG58_00295 [Bacilli bacterium]|nr:hypothetical protein [Bacilli bacterium]MBR3048985.1 hypothetical protein [Bacilli bacterium]